MPDVMIRFAIYVRMPVLATLMSVTQRSFRMDRHFCERASLFNYRLKISFFFHRLIFKDECLAAPLRSDK